MNVRPSTVLEIWVNPKKKCSGNIEATVMLGNFQMILKIFPKLNDVHPSNWFFSIFLYSRAPTSEKWKLIYSSKISATKLGKKSELKSTLFFSQLMHIAEIQRNFFLKKMLQQKSIKKSCSKCFKNH